MVQEFLILSYQNHSCRRVLFLIFLFVAISRLGQQFDTYQNLMVPDHDTLFLV